MRELTIRHTLWTAGCSIDPNTCLKYNSAENLSNLQFKIVMQFFTVTTLNIWSKHLVGSRQTEMTEMVQIVAVIDGNERVSHPVIPHGLLVLGNYYASRRYGGIQNFERMPQNPLTSVVYETGLNETTYEYRINLPANPIECRSNALHLQHFCTDPAKSPLFDQSFSQSSNFGRRVFKSRAVHVVCVIPVSRH